MFILIFILLFQNTNIDVYASDNLKYYARVMYDQVYLLKNPTEDNSYDNTIFELPKTYFVELLDKHGDFYKAKYMDLTGYVKKDGVQAILGTPQTPFLTNISFRVYAELSQNIWSCPTINQNSIIITRIPALTKNITFIGKINGECLIQGRTNLWYYCKYTEYNKDYYGYVYSDFCDEFTPISNNIEEFTYINNPTFEPHIQETSIPQDSNYIGIIIAILSIPALVFVFMIMKSSKILHQNKVKRKEIVDY